MRYSILTFPTRGAGCRETCPSGSWEGPLGKPWVYSTAADYWKEAIRLAPTNYIEAQNWLKMTGRSKGVESLRD
jgi:hypothetical protein